jgi:hypothetical protein
MLDIMISHNALYCEVYKSVWVVVDAINKHPQFGLKKYPSSQEEQQRIAREFRTCTFNIIITKTEKTFTL